MKRTIIKTGVVCLGLAGILAGYYPVSRATAASPAAIQSKAQATEVKIDNFSFSPQELTVAAGTKVTWINRDDIPHTVTSTSDKFKSKALDTDDQFSFTFDAPGTYEYFCSIHPKMTGKVIVK
ncbi:MAG TPA: cupredoxin family copper-binding protein [Candidatus Sulfotelmatobacter sp.]|nr:cupredoxin family copper-binding protein [Candidatus Sulfotelmatobacter sp.]